MNDELMARLGSALPAYRLERELGGGGMSRVFVAEETALARRVVIKVLGTGGAAVNAGRFRREILLSARLQHPNVVPVLTAGDVDGLPYFVMPYVDGESLRSRLRGAGPASLAEAVRLLRNVAAALAYAHRQDIVHRDIKPDNVMISGGVAVVLDFGVAKALAASSDRPGEGLTGAGLAVGTPAYMAPEQAAGDPNVDGRCDIYAFGILAYELLTASTPFGGEPARMLRAHLIEPPPPIIGRRADLPAPLARLVMRCLEKERQRRPQTADEVLDALDAMATPSGTRAGVRGGAERAWSGMAAALVPLVAYTLAAGLMIAGLRWLASQGEIGGRFVTLSTIGALFGLPVSVAAGQLLRIRRLERG